MNSPQNFFLFTQSMNRDIPHILVADDDRAIRMTLETGLALNGFLVTAVSSGREAIEAARKKSFAAVVCDIFMPDGDGMEVVRDLGVISPQTPIILITAQGSIDLTVLALSEGASDFIAKPFEIGALVNLLRRYVAARSEIAGTEERETEASMLLNDLSRTGLVGRSPAMVARATQAQPLDQRPVRCSDRRRCSVPAVGRLLGPLHLVGGARP